MTLTRFGVKEWGLGGVAAIILLAGAWFLGKYGNVWCGVALAGLVLLAYIALAGFFRNPRRVVPADPALILSPADGVVKDIGELEDFVQAPFTGKARRIGIFLSVLDVHVNRAPTDWTVIAKQYRPGRYLDARNPDCAKENEAMTLSGTARTAGIEFPLAVRQISGAIARRIVCPVEPGRALTRGKIYGMIKFGSRTELYLPCDPRIEIAVKPGDRVKAGVSVLARIAAPEAVQS